jgi:hypothetical protein
LGKECPLKTESTIVGKLQYHCPLTVIRESCVLHGLPTPAKLGDGGTTWMTVSKAIPTHLCSYTDHGLHDKTQYQLSDVKFIEKNYRLLLCNEAEHNTPFTKVSRYSGAPIKDDDEFY